MAASWSYSVLDDGATYGPGLFCPVRDDAPDFHCDLPFYGYPGLTEMTLQVATEEAGPTVASEIVQLRPFNYCGDDIVEIIVSSSDAGEPVFSQPWFETACGPS